MRVLVCGGRDFGDKKLMKKVLTEIHTKAPISCIIHGSNKGNGPMGADLLAKYWAASRGIKSEAYEAEWDRYGRAAGPYRNSEMIAYSKPDLVVAFPGGKGTADCVKRADLAGLTVIRVPASPINSGGIDPVKTAPATG